jgi:tricorn protease
MSSLTNRALAMTMSAAPAALTAASLLLSLAACQGIAASGPEPSATPAAPRTPTAPAFADLGVAPAPIHPSLSPDGSTVVFSWAGDLWAARLDWGGGKDVPRVRTTLRLTAHPADERRSAFSADGRMLAFESNRDGARNLYVMPLAWDTEGDWLAAGSPRRVTFSDAAQTLGGFTADGTALLLSANQEPTVYRQARMYRAPLDGGTVTRVTDAYGFLPRASADGSSILFARGYSSALDRPAYRGSGNLELYRFTAADGTFTRLTTSPANDLDAWQAQDGRVYFLSSREGQYNLFRLDPSRDEQGVPTQLTRFAIEPGQVTIGHGVRDLAISGDGRRGAFVVWDTLYAMTLEGGTPQALAIPLSGDTAQLDTQRLNLDKSVTEAALSPDGKTLALVARGEIFVRSTEEGRPTRRVTDTPGRERDIAWSPDGKMVYFASDEPGAYGLFTAEVTLSREDLETKPADAQAVQEDVKKAADAAAAAPAPEGAPAAAPPEGAAAPTPAAKKEPKVDHGKRWAESILFEVKPFISAGKDDCVSPLPSPDGTKLLYTRGRGDLVELTLETKAERVLMTGWDAPEVIWASDSRHVVYAVSDLDYNSDIWLLDTKGGGDGAATKAINLTQHPDNDVSPRLSADGKVLTFLSERAGQNGEFDVWQVVLDKRLDGLKPYELDEYYKKAAEAAGKRKPLGAAAAPDKKGDGEAKGDEKKEEKKEPAALELVFDADDAFMRVRRVTSAGASGLTITPAADRILYSATVDAERSLFSIDRKGEDRKVIQAGPVSGVGMSLTGDKVTFVRQGSAFAAPPKGGKVEAYAIDAPVVLDVATQQRRKFLEAARIIGNQFYHPTLKGLDWDGLTRRYVELAAKTRTSEEFDRVVEMLFGELNGSHLGINSPGSYTAARPGVGVLGASVEPVADGYKVLAVVEGSPADQRTSRLEAGDVIVAIDGRSLAKIQPMPDMSQLLLGKAGKETLLEVRRGKDGASERMLIVPTTSAGLNEVGYQAEVKRRRKLVDEWSGGKLGYLHIRAMGDASVREFERDLYAAAHDKDGLIIDVRDNGGGYTTDILLSSLTAPAHARTYPRGIAPEDVPEYAYPRDRRLIYAYARPINVLINENSFSNAEVFAHAIHTIKRGTLVGTATFGGVISTGAATLLDGSTVRTPGRGWILPDGKDMENNGAQPEVPVAQTPTDEAAGRDPQLEAAVRELLGRAGGAK